MSGRPGQLFRQALQQDLADDSGTPQRYDLDANFWIEGEGISITTANIATRLRLTGHVVWSLRAHDAARTRLTGGSSRMVDGLNVLDQQYFASDLETETVQKRLANALASQVATQLAIFFRQRADTAG
jgi:LPS-assembly lipoprotein